LGNTADNLIPEFQGIHQMGARLAQECLMLQAHDFMSIIFPNEFRVPSYSAWLGQTDLGPVYATHRRQLQYLQWRCPGVRWALKSTGHFWGLDRLFETYPDARVVFTHRDPLKFLGSHASLVSLARQIASDQVDPREIGPEWINTWETAARRAMAFRASGRADAKQCFDVQYVDFVKDPVDMISKVYDYFGLELSPEARGRMRAFLAANPQGKHGTHRYRIEQFGLDPAAVRERFRFYSEHYHVQPEKA
jgi:hypothetical protein